MKKISLVLISITILVAGWYLFVKKYGYEIRFESKYGQGSIYYDFVDASIINESQITIEKKYEEIIQKKHLGDTLFTFKWRFLYKTDSTTRVIIQVRNENAPLSSRLNILNPINARYSNQLKTYFKEYHKYMVASQKDYEVTLTGQDSLEHTSCVCTTTTTSLSDKATAMRSLLFKLQEFFDKNKIKQIDNPLLRLTDWDTDKEKITFDFCFPILDRSNLVKTPHTFITQIDAANSLTSEFKGNYRYSHRAWQDLKLQAKRDHIELSDTLIEVYYNNPMIDNSSSRTWKSKTYIPINKP